MKRLGVFLILIGLTVISSSVYAQRYEIGADVAVKVEYFRFTDSTFRDLGAQDGIYVGIEAYKQLCAPNLYFGMEIGWAGTSGGFGANVFNNNQLFTSHVDTSVDYVPIEFNTKYVFDINPSLFFDVGAGISLNYLNIEASGSAVSASESDWLFGGQFFSEMNYKITPNLFAGIGVKYQITESTSVFGANTDASADNLRVGTQLGYNF